MKTTALSLLALALAATIASHAQSTTTPNLQTVPSGHGWKGAVAATKVIEKDGQPAIAFNQPGANVVWLDGFDFTNGEIEFDARGRSAPVQGSFVGVAFHVRDAKTYDSVYFRPFNFRADDPERKAHAVQYVSEPEWPWSKLRQEKPGQYEKPLAPAPDGDAWFHARLVIAKPKISVFVNGAKEPSLVVTEIADRRGGSVGLWCNTYGQIANLRITRAGD